METIYFAIHRHCNEHYEGTLASILNQLEGDDADVDDFYFTVKGEILKVELIKKLVVKE